MGQVYSKGAMHIIHMQGRQSELDNSGECLKTHEHLTFKISHVL